MTFSVNRSPQPSASLPSSPSPMVSQNSLPVLRPFSSRPPWSSRPRRYGGGALGFVVPAHPTPRPVHFFVFFPSSFFWGEGPCSHHPRPLLPPRGGGTMSLGRGNKPPAHVP